MSGAGWGASDESIDGYRAARRSGWQRLYDWLRPWCPSGLRHRVKVGVVEGSSGWKGCWHRDCFRAARELERAEVARAKLADKRELAELIAEEVVQALRAGRLAGGLPL